MSFRTTATIQYEPMKRIGKGEDRKTAAGLLSEKVTAAVLLSSLGNAFQFQLSLSTNVLVDDVFE